MSNPNTIPFVKIEGAGNDFILIDNREGYFSDDALRKLAPKICARRFGVGSDGLIALEDPDNLGLVMNYKNPDGSDAGMCGNGARCFVRYANLLGYENPMEFRVHDRLYTAQVSGGQIRIHFPLETSVSAIDIDGEEMLQVYTNTEHIVCPADGSDLDPEDQLVRKGRRLRYHSRFSPAGTNVNFIAGTGENRVTVQTYERGVENLTYACGTGAIASALAWHAIQDAPAGDFQYYVDTKGGTLTVSFTVTAEPGRTYTGIRLEGPANIVFEGNYHYEPDAS